MNLVEEIMRKALSASEASKKRALRVLIGEEVVEHTVEKRFEMEPFCTMREASRHTGLSVPTLWRYRVPKHVLGGKPRCRMSEVEAYLNSEEFRVRADQLRAERRALRSKGGAA